MPPVSAIGFVRKRLAKRRLRRRKTEPVGADATRLAEVEKRTTLLAHARGGSVTAQVDPWTQYGLRLPLVEEPTGWRSISAGFTR